MKAAIPFRDNATPEVSSIERLIGRRLKSTSPISRLVQPCVNDKVLSADKDR